MNTITFVPVSVNRGRKFRGRGFIVGYTVSSFGTDTAKIWDPSAKRFGYAAASFCAERPLTEAEIAAARDEYVNDRINDTVAWCRSKSSDENDAIRFARNVIRKYNPEFLERFDAQHGVVDNRDVVKEVESTVQWALGLKTRACMMYGRYCPGGKLLPEAKRVAIAKKALEKKGITRLEGFNEAWEFILAQFSLKDNG